MGIVDKVEEAFRLLEKDFDKQGEEFKGLFYKLEKIYSKLRCVNLSV